jgi:hypothetical protein
MRRVGQLNEHAVWSGPQALNDQRFAARVDPVPRRIVHRNMYVPDSRHDIECGRAIDGENAQILRSIRDDGEPTRECGSQRRRNQETCRFLDRRSADAGQIKFRAHG